MGMLQAECSVDRNRLNYLYSQEVYRDVLLEWLDVHRDRQSDSVQYLFYCLQSMGITVILVLQPTNAESEAQL